MNWEDIKKSVLHDSVVHEQTLNEYFDQIDMKYEKNLTFDDLINMLKNTCKLKEKDEGKTRAKKQESRYIFKGPVIVEDEEGENRPMKRYKYIEDENEKENWALNQANVVYISPIQKYLII